MKKVILIFTIFVTGFSHSVLAQTDTLKSAIYSAGFRQTAEIIVQTVTDGGIVAHEGIDMNGDMPDTTFYDEGGFSSDSTAASGRPIYHVPGTGTYWVIFFEPGVKPIKLTNSSIYIQPRSGVLVSAPNVKMVAIEEDFYSYTQSDNKPIKMSINFGSLGAINIERHIYSSITSSDINHEQMNFYNRSGLAIIQTNNKAMFIATDTTYWIVPFDVDIAPFQLTNGDTVFISCGCNANSMTGCVLKKGINNNLVCEHDNTNSCESKCKMSIAAGQSTLFVGGSVLIRASNLNINVLTLQEEADLATITSLPSSNLVIKTFLNIDTIKNHLKHIGFYPDSNSYTLFKMPGYENYAYVVHDTLYDSTVTKYVVFITNDNLKTVIPVYYYIHRSEDNSITYSSSRIIGDGNDSAHAYNSYPEEGVNNNGGTNIPCTQQSYGNCIKCAAAEMASNTATYLICLAGSAGIEILWPVALGCALAPLIHCAIGGTVTPNFAGFSFQLYDSASSYWILN